MTYISSYKNQNWLLPTSIKQMIPQNHISFFVEEFVESLDFSGFDMISESPGHPAYHPQIIMKIIIQGMLSKERSSRKLASACRENFVFMYLAEKVQPDFRTIARFRKNNASFIKEAFKETINLASEHSLIDLNLICTDGSKIKANASKKAFLKKEQLSQLDLIIDKMIEEDIEQDETDKESYDKEENITSLEMKNLKAIVKNYRNVKNKEKLKENCKKAMEEFDKDPQIKRASLSDPECRMMKNKKGFFELDYNVQFTVDSKSQIIVANDVCQDRTDTYQLQPQIKNVKENINLKKDTKIAADCNYNVGSNLKFLEENFIEGYIPTLSQAQELDEKEKTIKEDDYEYDWKKDEIILKGARLKYIGTWSQGKKSRRRIYRSDDGKIVKKVIEFFRERLRMKEKMETVDGKHIYSLRKTVVEPVIGNIKYNLGFNEFLVRGLNGAKLELNIASIAHNLKKIWIMRGKICKNNKNLFFELITSENYLNYGTACKEQSVLKQ